MQIKVDTAIEDYIRGSSTELRICTTCDGPMLLPVRLKPPKPTDQVIIIGEKNLYISAVYAHRIKVIDISMMPSCALHSQK